MRWRPAAATLLAMHSTTRHQTLILGGGFGGAYVARLLGKRGATIVSPDSAMLYTPLLPEVAAGGLSPRHAVVPLRMMCPHAELVRGRAVALDERARSVAVETDVGPMELEYERLVLALGAVPRVPPVPGLAEHGLGFKRLSDAIRLRSHVLRQLELAQADRANAERHLTFVFVGAGYAGVEALAELHQLVSDAGRHYPVLHTVPQRWVLVDAGPRVLAEVPTRLSEYTASLLSRRGVDLRLSTTLQSVEPDAVTLADGTRIDTETLVWTAGVAPNPLLADLGLPLDDRGRVVVDSKLRVHDRDDVFAIGDCARVPNEATPERPDPPTCQHALRQARRLSKSLRGRPKPYRYRSLGGGATLGRAKGIASVFGLKLRGVLGAAVIRAYHVHQVPLLSRRLRVLADGAVSLLCRRDIAELGGAEPPRPGIVAHGHSVHSVVLHAGRKPSRA
jgi:NADH:ubiquinone reductase (H+-translocating)